jgi:hypothetical protein
LARRLVCIASHFVDDDIHTLGLVWIVIASLATAVVVICCYSAVVSHLNLSIIVIPSIPVPYGFSGTIYFDIFDILLKQLEKTKKHLVNLSFALSLIEMAQHYA